MYTKYRWRCWRTSGTCLSFQRCCLQSEEQYPAVRKPTRKNGCDNTVKRNKVESPRPQKNLHHYPAPGTTTRQHVSDASQLLPINASKSTPANQFMTRVVIKKSYFFYARSLQKLMEMIRISSFGYSISYTGLVYRCQRVTVGAWFGYIRGSNPAARTASRTASRTGTRRGQTETDRRTNIQAGRRTNRQTGRRTKGELKKDDILTNFL